MSRHDQRAETTGVGTNHYLNELGRRDQQRQTEAMLRYTRWVTLLTVVITVLTVANLAFVARG